MLGETIDFKRFLLTKQNISLLDNYDCENLELNNYFKNNAINDTKTVTSLFVNKANSDVICLYSLSCSGILLFNSTQIIPAVEIKMFGMHKEYQQIQYSDDRELGYLSDVLLSYIIKCISNFTDYIFGADMIVLYSTPNAIHFYKRNGFIDFSQWMQRSDSIFLDGCIPMYYPF